MDGGFRLTSFFHHPWFLFKMGIDFTNTMKNKTDYLSPYEIDKMLAYCKKTEDFRGFMLILTLYHTGRRVSEIVGASPFENAPGFRPCDIHPDGLIEFDILKKNHIKKKTKLGSIRSPDTILKLQLEKKPKRKLKAVDTEYLHCIKHYIRSNNIGPYERIFPLSRVHVFRLVRDIAKNAGVVRNGHIHPHNFRHSYAINILKKRPNDAGVLRQLQELLDHSDIKITMDYANFTQDDKKDMLNDVFNE